MRKGKILATAVAFAAVLAGSSALAGNLGVAADAALPSGSFNDGYDTGFGIHAIFKLPVTPLVTITGDGGWTGFGGKGDISNINVWNVTGGGTVNLLPLGLGAEYGYFTEVKDWSLVPYASFGFSKLDLALRYKATGDAKWWELRVGVRF